MNSNFSRFLIFLTYYVFSGLVLYFLAEGLTKSYRENETKPNRVTQVSLFQVTVELGELGIGPSVRYPAFRRRICCYDELLRDALCTCMSNVGCTDWRPSLWQKWILEVTFTSLLTACSVQPRGLGKRGSTHFQVYV